MSSCLAVSKHVSGVAHSRACCWQYRKTPTSEPSRRLPIRITEYSNGPRWTWLFVGVVRKSDRLTFARGCTMPAPGTGAGGGFVLTRVNRFATTRRLAAALALIASTTCALVLVSAPAALVARLTRM